MVQFRREQTNVRRSDSIRVATRTILTIPTSALIGSTVSHSAREHRGIAVVVLLSPSLSHGVFDYPPFPSDSIVTVVIIVIHNRGFYRQNVS
jgi:hypothetical protein